MADLYQDKEEAREKVNDRLRNINTIRDRRNSTIDRLQAVEQLNRQSISTGSNVPQKKYQKVDESESWGIEISPTKSQEEPILPDTQEDQQTITATQPEQTTSITDDIGFGVPLSDDEVDGFSTSTQSYPDLGIDVKEKPDSILDMILDPNYADALIEGGKQSFSRAGSTFDVLTGDNLEVEQDAKQSALLSKNSLLVNKKRFLKKAKQNYDEAEGFFNTLYGLSDAMYQEKAGVVELVAEQAPNTVGTLASGYLGGKGGLAIGTALAPFTYGASIPVFTTAGFIAGMFGFNMFQEVGAKAQEKGLDGFTEAERKESLKEGATKAGVITAVDVVTFGATKAFMNTANRAIERATIDTLNKNNVDVAGFTRDLATFKKQVDLTKTSTPLRRDAFITGANRIAQNYGLGEKAVRDSVTLAHKKVKSSLDYIAKKAMTPPVALTLETAGEGFGEYLGELVATGEADAFDAIIEAIAGGTQSVAQVMAGGVNNLYGQAVGRREQIGQQVTEDVDLIDATIRSDEARQADEKQAKDEKIQSKVREKTEIAQRNVVSLFEDKDNAVNSLYAMHKKSASGDSNTDKLRVDTIARIAQDLGYEDDFQELVGKKGKKKADALVTRREEASENLSQSPRLRRNLEDFIDAQSEAYAKGESLNLRRTLAKQTKDEKGQELSERERANIQAQQEAKEAKGLIDLKINKRTIATGDAKKAEQDILGLDDVRPKEGENLRGSVKPETDSVNVFYGANENKELSNLAQRPFKFKDRSGRTRTYQSVEHAYQTLKFDYLLDKKGYKNPAGVIRDQDRIYKLDWKEGSVFRNEVKRVPIDTQDTPKSPDFNEKKISATPQSDLQIHQQFGGGTVAEFNEQALSLMKKLVRASAFATADRRLIEDEKGDKFVAPEELSESARAFQRALMKTGNKKITHLQGGKFWNKAFPEALEELRDSLKASVSNQKLKNKVKLTKRNNVSQSINAKDQAKADLADKFIGQGGEGTSTDLYQKDFDRYGLANMGTYSATDKVFVSANGNAPNRLNPDFEEINKAVRAGATFITDSRNYVNKSKYNKGERQISSYLISQGYQYNDLQTADGITVGQYTPKTESLRGYFNSISREYIQLSVAPKDFNYHYGQEVKDKLGLRFPSGLVDKFFENIETVYKNAYDEYYGYDAQTKKYKNNPEEFKNLLIKNPNPNKIREYFIKKGLMPNLRLKNFSEISLDFERFYGQTFKEAGVKVKLFVKGKVEFRTPSNLKEFNLAVEQGAFQKAGKFIKNKEGVFVDYHPRFMKYGKDKDGNRIVLDKGERRQVFLGRKRDDDSVEFGQFTKQVSQDDKDEFVMTKVRQIIGAVDVQNDRDNPPYIIDYVLANDYYINKPMVVGVGMNTKKVDPIGSHSNPLNLSFKQRQKIYDAYTKKNATVIDMLQEELKAKDVSEEKKVEIGKELKRETLLRRTKKPKGARGVGTYEIRDISFQPSMRIAFEKAKEFHGSGITRLSSLLNQSFDYALNNTPLFRYIVRNKLLKLVADSQKPYFGAIDEYVPSNVNGGFRNDSFTLSQEEYDLGVEDLRKNYKIYQQGGFVDESDKQEIKERKAKKSVMIAGSQMQYGEFARAFDRLSKDQEARDRFNEMFENIKEKYFVTEVDGKHFVSFKIESKDARKKQEKMLEGIFGYYEPHLNHYADFFKDVKKILNDPDVFARYNQSKAQAKEANEYLEELEGILRNWDENELTDRIGIKKDQAIYDEVIIEKLKKNKASYDQLYEKVTKYIRLDDTDNKVREELDRDTEGRDKEQRPTEGDRDKLRYAKANLEKFLSETRDASRTTPLLDLYFKDSIIKSKLEVLLNNYLDQAEGYSTAQQDQEVLRRYVQGIYIDLNKTKKIAEEEMGDLLRREVYQEDTNTSARILEYYKDQIPAQETPEQTKALKEKLEGEITTKIKVIRDGIDKDRRLEQKFINDGIDPTKQFNIDLSYHTKIKNEIRSLNKNQQEELFLKLADEYKAGRMTSMAELDALYNAVGMSTPITWKTLMSYPIMTISLSDFVAKRGTGYQAKAEYFSSFLLFQKRLLELKPNSEDFITKIENKYLSLIERAEFNDWLETELLYLARKHVDPTTLLEKSVKKKTKQQMLLERNTTKKPVSLYSYIVKDAEKITADPSVLDKFLFSRFSLTDLRGFRYLDEKDQYFLSNYIAKPIIRTTTADQLHKAKQRNVKQLLLLKEDTSTFSERQKEQIEFKISKATQQFRNEVAKYTNIFKPSRPIKDSEYIQWFDMMMKNHGKTIERQLSALEKKSNTIEELNAVNSQYQFLFTSPSEITSFKRSIDNYKKLENEYIKKITNLQNVARVPIIENDVVDQLVKAWHSDLYYARKRYKGFNDKFKELVSVRDQQEYIEWIRDIRGRYVKEFKKARVDPVTTKHRSKDVDGFLQLLEDYNFNRKSHTEKQLNSDKYINIYNDQKDFILYYMENEHPNLFKTFLRLVKDNKKPKDDKLPLADIKSSYRLNDFYFDLKQESNMSDEPSFASEAIPIADEDIPLVDEYDNIHPAHRVYENEIMQEEMSKADLLASMGLDSSDVYNQALQEDLGKSKNIHVEDENIEVNNVSPNKDILDDPNDFRASIGVRSGVSAGMNTHQYVEEITKDWKYKPNIKYFTDIKSTPEPLRTKLMTKFGGKGDLKGLFDTDTNQVYLFTDNLNDDIRDVEFTLFHEIYGHLGMRGFLGDEFDGTLNTLYLTNSTVKKLADQKAKDLKLGRIEAVEEALADLAGRGDQSKLLRRIFNKFTEGLRKIGFVRVAQYLDKITMDELGYILKSSRDWAKEQGIKVFDGSPVSDRPTLELFGKVGNTIVGYATYNVLSDSWTVVHRNGLNLETKRASKKDLEEFPYIHYTVDDYERVVDIMKKETKAKTFDENKFESLYKGDKARGKAVKIFDATDTAQAGTLSYARYRVWQWVQNGYLPVFTAMRKLEKQGLLKTIDDLRIYFTNYERKQAEDQKSFKNQIVKPLHNLVEDASNLGATIEDLDEYLVATTAEETNLQILRNRLPEKVLDYYKRLLTANIDEDGKVHLLMVLNKKTNKYEMNPEYRGRRLNDFELREKTIEWATSEENKDEEWNQPDNLVDFTKNINWTGSGMSRSEYEKILKENKTKAYGTVFEEIGNTLDALGDRKVDLLVESGMISQQEGEKRKGAYRHYRTMAGTEQNETDDALAEFRAEVPSKTLFGKSMDKEIVFVGGAIGKKLNVRGRDKRRVGRKTIAQNVLAQTLVSYQTAMLRANKNRVAKKVLDFLSHHRDDSFVTIQPNEKLKIIDEKGNISYYRDNEKRIKSEENLFVARVNGQAITMQFTYNDKGSFSESINGFIYPPDQNWVLYQMGRGTKVIGRLMTTWNPFWVPINFVRDVETVYSNLEIEKNMPKGSAVKMLGYLFPASRVALYDALESYKPNVNTAKGKAVDIARRSIMRVVRPLGGTRKFNYLLKMMKEGKKNGAFTAFLDRGNLDDQILELDNLIGGIGKERPKGFKKYIKYANPLVTGKEGISAMFNALEAFTIPFEIAPRLATYAVARDPLFGNLDGKESAVMSGEVSVNFNMRGSADWLRNSYLFFNPAVQGTSKMVKLAYQNPKRFARIAMMWIVIGQLGNVIARSLSSEEDDEEGDALEKVPTYKRSTMLILFPNIEGGALPIAYGWNAFFSVGHYMTDLVLGRMSTEQTIKNISTSVFEAFSPIATGVSDANSIASMISKAIAPTITQGATEWWLNENRFGSPIYKDSLFGRPEMSDTEMAFRNVNPVSYKMARWIQENTPFNAGNMYNQEGIDINPAMIDHLTRSYLSGVPNEAWQTYGRYKRREMGIDIPEDQTYFARRFSAMVPPRRHIGVYQVLRSKINTLYNEYKNIPDYIGVGGESGRFRKDDLDYKYPNLTSNYYLIQRTDQRIKDETKYLNDEIKRLKIERLETGVNDQSIEFEVSELQNTLEELKKELYKEAIDELSYEGYRKDIIPFIRDN